MVAAHAEPGRAAVMTIDYQRRGAAFRQVTGAWQQPVETNLAPARNPVDLVEGVMN
jgi:hypothetical protein